MGDFHYVNSSFGIDIISFFRMHVLASAIAISKSGAAQMATIPDKLIYVRPTTRTPLDNETNLNGLIWISGTVPWR